MAKDRRRETKRLLPLANPRFDQSDPAVRDRMRQAMRMEYESKLESAAFEAARSRDAPALSRLLALWNDELSRVRRLLQSDGAVAVRMEDDSLHRPDAELRQAVRDTVSRLELECAALAEAVSIVAGGAKWSPASRQSVEAWLIARWTLTTDDDMIASVLYPTASRESAKDRIKTARGVALKRWPDLRPVRRRK